MQVMNGEIDKMAKIAFSDSFERAAAITAAGGAGFIARKIAEELNEPNLKKNGEKHDIYITCSNDKRCCG